MKGEIIVFDKGRETTFGLDNQIKAWTALTGAHYNYNNPHSPANTRTSGGSRTFQRGVAAGNK